MTRRRQGSPYLDVVESTSARTSAMRKWALDLLADGPTPTVQFAVYQDGELVCSLAGGHQEAYGHATRQSLYPILSCSKYITTLVMLTLRERGYFDWDDTIASFWPEFGTKGKERITIRHVMTHRAGIRLGPSGSTWGWWGQRDVMSRWLEGLDLEWEPGEGVGYHNRVWGFVLDEVVRRTTGRELRDVLHQDIRDPLRVTDLYLGIDDSLRSRVVPLVTTWGERQRTDPQAARDEEFRPCIHDEPNIFNTIEYQRLPLAWGMVIATAEATAELGNLYALAGMHRGLRLFSVEAFEEACRPHSREGERDATLQYAADWGIGVHLNPFRNVPESARSLGHGGGSTAYVWADPEHRLSVALLTSGNPRSGEEVNAIRGGLAEAVYADVVR
jgi:CubicO group peptidase (beta-lactamase class C family)